MRSKNRTLPEWFSIVTECRKSGLTDIEWCRRNAINYEAFKTAAKRLRSASILLPSRAKLNCIDLTVATKPDVVKVDIVNEAAPEPALPRMTDHPASPTEGPSITVHLESGEIRIENNADPRLVACVLRTIGGLSC